MRCLRSVSRHAQPSTSRMATPPCHGVRSVRPWVCRCTASETAGDLVAEPSPSTTEAAAAPAGAPGEQPVGPPKSKKVAPHVAVSEALDNVSITIVGDDTALNWAICQALAKKIGWFAVSTAKVLTGLHKADSLEALAQALGPDGLAKEEAQTIHGLRSQFRCCLATLGNGAAAQAGTYDNLWGSFIIWVDEADRRTPKADSPARQAYQQAEVRATIAVPTGFNGKALSLEDKAKSALPELIKALAQLLREHPYLPEKKRVYIARGCRGDWPVIQDEDWEPSWLRSGEQAAGACETGSGGTGGQEGAMSAVAS